MLFWLIFILIIGAAAYIGFVVYNYFYRELSGLDAFPFAKTAQNLSDWIHMKLRSNAGYQPGPFEQELPDFDEPSGGALTSKSSPQGKYGSIETTTYGSI
jgi:hypothetical protein